jgi:SET and MYND domain-containing protein
MSDPTMTSSSSSTPPPAAGEPRAGAPSTPLFAIRPTPFAGRAVFAVQHITASTPLWRATDLSLAVLLREYRREVCAQCFFYDRGRDLPIRSPGTGFAFCTPQCSDEWERGNGEVGTQAWRAVEALVKKRSKEDGEMVELGLPRPGEEEIQEAWESAEARAVLIRAAREAEKPRGEGEEAVRVTKVHRRAVASALQAKISPDVMAFIVSGVVWRHNAASEQWDALLALADDTTPYHSADDLAAFTRSYLHLLATLPLPLLPLLNPGTVFTLSSRDSHNSFGIRSLDDEGSEFFGYGCWPSASYFNHSCGPNVEKAREGREWVFRAGRDIAAGEELNITYLSGEERRDSREKRMQTLKRNWGFDCGCHRCREEGGKEEEGTTTTLKT